MQLIGQEIMKINTGLCQGLIGQIAIILMIMVMNKANGKIPTQKLKNPLKYLMVGVDEDYFHKQCAWQPIQMSNHNQADYA